MVSPARRRVGSGAPAGALLIHGHPRPGMAAGPGHARQPRQPTHRVRSPSGHRPRTCTTWSPTWPAWAGSVPSARRQVAGRGDRPRCWCPVQGHRTAWTDRWSTVNRVVAVDGTGSSRFETDWQRCPVDLLVPGPGATGTGGHRVTEDVQVSALACASYFATLLLGGTVPTHDVDEPGPAGHPRASEGRGRGVSRAEGEPWPRVSCPRREWRGAVDRPPIGRPAPRASVGCGGGITADGEAPRSSTVGRARPPGLALFAPDGTPCTVLGRHPVAPPPHPSRPGLAPPDVLELAGRVPSAAVTWTGVAVFQDRFGSGVWWTRPVGVLARVDRRPGRGADHGPGG